MNQCVKALILQMDMLTVRMHSATNHAAGTTNQDEAVGAVMSLERDLVTMQALCAAVTNLHRTL